ncbi:MAG: hypothetical protein ACAH59_04555 [Pseudobdellovibrionaceae bacterium]
MKQIFWLTFIFMTSTASALEPQNPIALCERFLEGPEKVECEKKMKDLSPDWYLATVCNQNFTDPSFYECVELTKTGAFSPRKLDLCTRDGISDSTRIACIKAAKTNTLEAFQNRQPAEINPKKSRPRLGSKRHDL